MTTKDTPREELKVQSDKIAKALKAMCDTPRAKSYIKFALVMDDKLLSIEIPWQTIDDTTEEALSEYILLQMQEKEARLQ